MISLMFDPDSDLFLIVAVIFYFRTQNFFYLSFIIRLNSVCPLYRIFGVCESLYSIC